MKKYIYLTLLSTLPTFAKPIHWCHYQNSLYHFSLKYPCYIHPTRQFKRFYHLTDNWSAAAVGLHKPGQVNVVSFPLTEIEGKDGFYYAAAVRMGVSTNPNDIKNCYHVNMYYKKSPIKHVNIHGTTFRRFPMTDNGMMQVMQGQSYRLLKRHRCYALEWVETGLNSKEFYILSKRYQPMAQKVIYSFSSKKQA